MVMPPPDGSSVREDAYATLNAGGRLVRAPALQEALDAIAARVADGSLSTKAGMKAAANLVKAGDLASGSARFGILFSGPGNTPEFGGYLPSGDMPVVAIGQATGNLGLKQNISYTVLVVVQAAKGR
jgi:hypothetical protein